MQSLPIAILMLCVRLVTVGESSCFEVGNPAASAAVPPTKFRRIICPLVRCGDSCWPCIVDRTSDTFTNFVLLFAMWERGRKFSVKCRFGQSPSLIDWNAVPPPVWPLRDSLV